MRGNPSSRPCSGSGSRSIPACAGNRHDAGRSSCNVGSIPACAGQPDVTGHHAYCLMVYPRVCGATLVDLRGSYVAIGLSPRVRGNPLSGTGHPFAHCGLSPRVRGNPVGRFLHPFDGGSIPACAGQPSGRPDQAKTWWVYPRVCGATDSTTHVWPLPRGLSPRVRGNPSPVLLPPLAARSIPACAGQPRHVRQPSCHHSVYPRVCGATSVVWALLSPVSGLSPRVRGNLVLFPSLAGGEQSIPACAGQPRSRAFGGFFRWVYPRVCGATCRLPQDILMVMGLSPRVRGNPPTNSEASTRPGSIPACAGQPTGGRILSVDEAGLSPRVRGNRLDGGAVRAVHGLSPRVRGNHYRASAMWSWLRSIPACAGQPLSCASSEC